MLMLYFWLNKPEVP